MKCSFLPIELRSRYQAGKFLLKHLSTPYYSFFQTFTSVKTAWSYTSQTLLILALVTFFIFSSLFDHLPPDTLSFTSVIFQDFLGCTPNELPHFFKPWLNHCLIILIDLIFLILFPFSLIVQILVQPIFHFHTYAQYMFC